MTPEIRKILAETGQATADELAERLQIQTFAGLKQLRDALGELTRKGLLVKEERPPLYRLGREARERGEKQRSIWRAVQVEALGFTVGEIELLAGTSRDYTRRYLQWLAKLGYIVVAGARGVKDGIRPETVYKLAPGKERQQPPHWARVREERRGGS